MLLRNERCLCCQLIVFSNNHRPALPQKVDIQVSDCRKHGSILNAAVQTLWCGASCENWKLLSLDKCVRCLCGFNLTIVRCCTDVIDSMFLFCLRER